MPQELCLITCIRTPEHFYCQCVINLHTKNISGPESVLTIETQFEKYRIQETDKAASERYCHEKF